MSGPDAASGIGTPPRVNTSRDPAIDRRMLEALVCPMTHGTLSYDAERQELISKAAHLAYPIRNGIPIMLEEEARQLD
jgi:uncharacterized protein YbaR (Trm112 family)